MNDGRELTSMVSDNQIRDKPPASDDLISSASMLNRSRFAAIRVGISPRTLVHWAVKVANTWGEQSVYQCRDAEELASQRCRP